MLVVYHHCYQLQLTETLHVCIWLLFHGIWPDSSSLGERQQLPLKYVTLSFLVNVFITIITAHLISYHYMKYHRKLLIHLSFPTIKKQYWSPNTLNVIRMCKFSRPLDAKELFHWYTWNILCKTKLYVTVLKAYTEKRMSKWVLFHSSFQSFEIWQTVKPWINACLE